jgi:hypothetical protein
MVDCDAAGCGEDRGMSGHTPGAWSLKTVPTSCGICHMIGPFPAKPGTTRENYACVYADYPGNGPHDNELLANARLIAAAPMLLSALEQAVTSMQDSGYPNSHVAVREARTAIAEATGEQS